MKEDDAKRIVRTSIRALALFDQLLHKSQDALPPVEYERLKKAVGSIMGDISIDMLCPIFSAHPSLEPTEGDSEGWRKAGGLYESYWLEISPMPADESNLKAPKETRKGP